MNTLVASTRVGRSGVVASLGGMARMGRIGRVGNVGGFATLSPHPLVSCRRYTTPPHLTTSRSLHPNVTGGSTTTTTVKNPFSPSSSHPVAGSPSSSSSSPPSSHPTVPFHLDGTRFVGMTGAQIFHEMMRYHDVIQIFGYPGGAILPVFDAIHNSPYFHFVLPRHEQGGGHMAEGYARASGKPGVLLVTSGPGATNAVTPMQDALMDGVPLIVFSGQVATHLIGTDAFQEANVVGITSCCTKWNCIVTDIKDLPRKINEAFLIATSGRPGPVLVDLPKDVTAATLKELPDCVPQVPAKFLLPTDHVGSNKTAVDFNRIATLINNAKRPIIFAGHGIISAGISDLLRTFAEKANIPVTTTIHGLGAMNEHSDLSLHMLGMHGSAYANYAMQKADVIISLGARFDDRVTGTLKTFAPEAVLAAKEGRGGIIHFDILPRNINKVVQVTEPVLGDLKETLPQLLPLVRHSPRTEWFEAIQKWKKDHPFAYNPSKEGGPLKPQAVLTELNTQLQKKHKDNYLVTTGVGQHQMWAAQYIRWTIPRSFLSSGGAGTMGFGLPAAIGAKIARPDMIVIDVDGDASLTMTAVELITAVQYNIGVKVLLLNNNFLGMVKQWQDLFYDERHSQTKMFNPDFALFAQSMGAKGLCLTKQEDIPRVIEEFLNTEGPVLLNEKDEHVYPMVPSGKALHEMVFKESAGSKLDGLPPS